MNNREISVGDIHGCFKELKSPSKVIDIMGSTEQV